MSYLETVEDLYAEASREVHEDLCCVERPLQKLPGLVIPQVMSDMDYGCGTTVHLGELSNEDDILYVGIGGGMEALQFSYFTRRPGSVIAVDRVADMREKARLNFMQAEKENDWFSRDFVKITDGDALCLPLPDACVDVAAQNCLFNVFKEDDLLCALREMHRVLRPGGRLYISDPVTTAPIPQHLKEDERLRAMCLSGALFMEDYIAKIAEAGFSEIQIRARRPYRLLDQRTYHLEQDILLDTVELVAIKTENQQGLQTYLGEMAVYKGAEAAYTDASGKIFRRGVPVYVSHQAAETLRAATDFVVTEPDFHYPGHKPEKPGCCCCGTC